MSYVTNNDWAACSDMIHNDLLGTTSASLTFENTISCYYNDSVGQPTFFQDPCCNLRYAPENALKFTNNLFMPTAKGQ